MSFYLSEKAYNQIIGNTSKSKEESTPYLGIETTPAKPEQQGIIGDVVDSVQMGAWKGLSDLAHGLGAITGADWLHKAGDLAAKGADENMATMSDEMKSALNQSALDGEGKGIANIRWWAGNLGSILGQNLDTVLTLGFGKVATIGVKQAGKMLLKREAAEQVGKIAVEQAAKRGVPQKYLDMVGYTAIQTAMSGGSRYGQKRDEVMAMDNETLAKLPEFSNAYYEIADSDEGKDKTVEELYSLAKTRFADKVGQSAALNPTAIMTDIGVNAISGLGGGFKGLLSPAQTVKGGLVKGALIEGGTEAVQGVAEQYALNQAQKEYIDPNQDLTEGMQENAINGAILGGVFGGMMGGIDSHSHRRELNQQKRTILEHINTGDVEIDEKLRRYTDSINQSATDLADLVKMSQVQRWNNQGQAFREKQQQQAQRAQFESDFFGEEQAEAQAENIEPEFKPDSNLDRALDLHSILTQFRKNDFSRANEFIDTPMVFSDEQAKKDHVTEKALTEVRNIAQQYGINPQDGKAMRQWLEDYAEEVEKYRDNNKSASPENNVQFSENFSPDKEQMATEFKPQPMNLNEEAASELHTNSSIDSRNEMGETTDTFEQPTQQDNPEITLDQSPFEEAKNITSQIQENADGSVSDDSQSVFTPENNIDDEFKTYSRSAMKSVESNIKRGREAMNAAITEKRTVHRAMFNHNLDGWVDFEWGDDGLTKSFNKKGEPVGKGISHIIEARMRKDGMSYEQVTQMLTRDIVDTIAKGSIVGHWVRNDGKSESIQIDYNGYRAGLIRNKGSNAWLLTAFELYPTDVDSAGSVDAEKTTHFKPTLTRQEMGAASTDNVQQSNFQSNQQSQINPEIEQAHQILKQTFGNASEHIEVTTFANPPEDVKNLITSDVEGWFNPKTGKITIVADSIKATKSMSRKERLQFVAWHEMAHRGINVEFKEDYHSVMQEVGKNKMVSKIADAIQTQRKGTDDLSVTNRTVAIEEALAEIMAAQETGKWEELQQRYGVSFHKGQMKSARAWLEMTAERLRNFITKLFGHEIVQRMSNQEVLNLVARIKQSAVKTEQVSSNNDIRFSLNENADSDFAKAVDDIANGKFSSQIIEVGTTPSVLKMLGLPDANVVISGSVLKKVMLGKHNVTPDTLKQLPKQINDPVAVMKSSTQQNGYVVLTELTENVNGVNKPVVAALHLKQTSQGIELINIASVYGRNNSQIQRGLENDLLYWNKKKGANFLDNLTLQLRSPLSETNSTKGSQFLTAFGLQLPSHMQSDVNLSVSNTKTEAELSQYQSENSDTRFSRKANNSIDQHYMALAKRYKNGDSSVESELRNLVNDRAQEKGFGKPNYRMQHEAPNSKDEISQSIDNLKSLYPDDLYSSKGYQYYGTGYDAMDRKAWDILKRIKGKPDDTVTIYRAYPKGTGGTITNGDWVTIVRDYAVEHGEANLGGDYQIVSKDVKASEVFTNADSLLEQGYDNGLSEVVNDKKKIKLDELITYDDDGEIIPLSKRFNARKNDIRFSRANTTQSARNLAKTGKAQTEPSLWDNLMRGDLNGFKRAFHQTVSKLDEYLADSLRPVNDWIDNLSLADQTGNTSSRDHEKRRLKDAMYTAKGKRDAMNSELEQAYLKPILSKIAAMSKATKKTSHYIDELTMKRMVGNWISARYAIEKNRELLARDKATMDDAKRQLDDARQQGANSETINRLNNAYLKAKAQYDDRKADIHNTDYDNEKRFKVGVAGGWSIPEAQDIMNDTERYLSRAQLEEVANLIYELNQAKLDIDRASGRFTDKEYQQYKANRHYVPLTGDPNADIDSDIISGAGSSAVNIGRDKTMKGRTNSEAEDAIDAVWKSVGKSTTYAGFAEFKSRIDDLYETEVTLLKNKGYSDAEAREQATANLGISKRKMQGLTRSSDNVLIRKEGSDYYEYELPTQVMESLRNDNVEHANAFLKVISKPTGWYARGVTQWTVTFAPMNMLRDTWEKSEFIRVQKLYDKNNRLVDSKTMDKIGRDTIKNALADKEVWQATKRLGFGQELRDSVPAERMLKQLLKEGGVSNYGTYLDKSEVDLIKKLRKENNPLASKLEKVGKVLEGYNKMFDTVSALASYKALVDNGIDSKQAAATTLELTNFRKTGSKMRGIKALYMFSQPTVMGAANLMRYLSTRKGQIRFIGYMAVMTSLYTVLRSMDDEDEGGNKMDQLGDITRYIPIPLGEGKYFKIPVGFGMAQMAWNFSTNIVKGAVGDISLTEAGANMLVHSLKTFSPVSPSEISAAKYPMEKIALTVTPTILQPIMQNVVNRSAFGNKITTNYVRDDKLKAEQSKATTAQFWKDVAINLNDTMGIDMHPEQIKNLFDGYSSMLGSLKELNTVFVENPNREELGRKARTLFLNQFIGTTNEFAIQSRYYEASEEAGSVYKEYKSRKERNELSNWLDADKMKLIKFHEQEESIVKKARSEKANLTRSLRSGKISAIAYENGIKRYNKDMSRVQAKMLHKYRIMEGLNTN
uniref:Large polyvalent protein associated domain 38 n=1 Tax=Podoviridae sp. ct9R41 TaxID=2825227 RepID=A0A8S5P8E7_9CAUD|nr:MAG TPA: Large polyvalent protein associated domain 38 [Podoviridae sp. ct9R41]